VLTPPRSLVRPLIGVGVVSLALLGTAIGLDAAAAAEYASLESSCAPVCDPEALGTLNLERGFAAANYALAGAAAVTSIVMLIVDRVRVRRYRSAQAQHQTGLLPRLDGDLHLAPSAGVFDVAFQPMLSGR
jgi:hypothetical protein